MATRVEELQAKEREARALTEQLRKALDDEYREVTKGWRPRFNWVAKTSDNTWTRGKEYPHGRLIFHGTLTEECAAEIAELQSKYGRSPLDDRDRSGRTSVLYGFSQCPYNPLVGCIYHSGGGYTVLESGKRSAGSGPNSYDFDADPTIWCHLADWEALREGQITVAEFCTKIGVEVL